MALSVFATKLLDVYIVKPKTFSDERGVFFEAYNDVDLSLALGRNLKFVQDNQSFSKQNVVRGLHYQTDKPQGKLVRVCSGSIYDVAVDLRTFSQTFGNWVGVELTAENKLQLWIPEGFAHGFMVTSSSADVLYKTTDYWSAVGEKTIAWDDPKLAIHWPSIDIKPLLSPKDSMGLSWNDAPKFNSDNLHII